MVGGVERRWGSRQRETGGGVGGDTSSPAGDDGELVGETDGI